MASSARRLSSFGDTGSTPMLGGLYARRMRTRGRSRERASDSNQGTRHERWFPALTSPRRRLLPPARPFFLPELVLAVYIVDQRRFTFRELAGEDAAGGGGGPARPRRPAPRARAPGGG